MNYNPSPTDASQGETAADANSYEFVEFLNTSDATVNLGGVRFTAGIEFTFAQGMSLESGQRGVIVSNVDAFRQRYGASPTVLGVYTGASATAARR